MVSARSHYAENSDSFHEINIAVFFFFFLRLVLEMKQTKRYY
jgi:hypothetical protein